MLEQTEKGDPMARNRNSYTKEFRIQAVELLNSGGADPDTRSWKTAARGGP